MTGELIELQVSAARYACGQMTALHLKALHDSIEQACRIPAAFWWDRKAAAHAEIFNLLADSVNEPLVGRVLSSGAGLAYDLMIAAGRAADGMITSSRQRLLAHLSGGDFEGAALGDGKAPPRPALHGAPGPLRGAPHICVIPRPMRRPKRARLDNPALHDVRGMHA